MGLFTPRDICSRLIDGGHGRHSPSVFSTRLHDFMEAHDVFARPGETVRSRSFSPPVLTSRTLSMGETGTPLSSPSDTTIVGTFVILKIAAGEMTPTLKVRHQTVNDQYDYVMENDVRRALVKPE